MNCRDVEQTVLDDLSACREDHIADHLSACGHCAGLVDQLQEIEQLRESLARATAAPSDFQGKVVDRAARSNNRPWLAVAAVLLLAAGAGWMQSSGVDSVVGPSSASRGVEAGSAASGWVGKQPISDEQYLEVLLTKPTGEPVILRIPKTIQVRQADLDRQFLTRVSH